MLASEPHWYKDAVIYEVHVRAFADSNGDGIGDFPGLTEKLDYLQDLGVTAIWLLPFYPSPLKDDGYDIADYTSIHPDYGTLRDFREFLKAAHARGLRVITELVINHTSDQHAWFQRARKAPAGSPERDFYLWSDTPDKFQNVRIIFPDFERSNWEWDSEARAYYWHRFYAHQPDLNYDNPAVWQAIFPVVDFWFGLGVDGMRLDAIPYLFAREGTACESLPETHHFLKELRKYVDGKYPDKMFLAEANQWPEDAVDYFGDGDECQMAFHFPLMPRMFVALQMEERFPIVDILDQTPPIPEGCQWCLFLRNHDELTLEMVTDSERDFMYRAYARDPRARINLGIRRRLAPLMHNSRPRIELLNALLFSLPGTPVVYYGDEIGMGDNIYVGDRNGVRTPMQWSADRNAGFSRCNPQRLYLPIIIDQEYHYESINVEAQQNNPNSLLWWMKRLVALRKQFRAFGRGSLEFLDCGNSRILAFTRRFESENILVVANLSRFAQYASLDLVEFQGTTPMEMFGRTMFPPVGRHPYTLSLGPHGFYWFALTAPKADADGPEADTPVTVPVVTVTRGADELFPEEGRGPLDAVLPAYFRKLGRGLSVSPWLKSTGNRESLKFRYGTSSVAYLILLTVENQRGVLETHTLPLTFADEYQLERLGEHAPVVAEVCRGGQRIGAIIDALADPQFCLAILGAIEAEGRYPMTSGELAGVALPKLAQLRDPTRPLTPHIVGRERTNPSVAFGDRWLLKMYRRIEEGTRLDLDVGRFLSDRKAEGVPPLVGYIEYRRPDYESVTLAVLHGYVPNEGCAWDHALSVLSRFFERALAEGGVPEVLARTASFGTPEGDLPGLIRDWAEESNEMARMIGERTASIHATLASDPDHPAFRPEPFMKPDQRSLYQSLRNLTGQTCYQLRSMLSRLFDEQQAAATGVLLHEGWILRRFRWLVDTPVSGRRIRCHGHYHLGHLLYTGDGYAVTDFEGDSERPLAERRMKRSPLGDVAAMVGSFFYVAHYPFLERGGDLPGVIRPEDVGRLQAWADVWFRCVANEFVRTYFACSEVAWLLPDSDDARRELLDIMLLERALQELAHELQHRLDWVGIPLARLGQLLGDTGRNTTE